MTAAPWYLAGPLLGLLIVALRAAVNKPFGVFGGYVELAEHSSEPRRLGLATFLLLGFVLGGVLYAMTLGTFSLSFDYPPGAIVPNTASQFIPLLLAGGLMGAGARLAGGCTSGHGLTGISLGSPASMVAMFMFFGVGVAVAYAFTALQ
jgi:uncharacterized protein